MISYFDKECPLTVSMWDFSWLMGNHPGGAYEDLSRRIEEAKERGYDTLRIDTFPSHLLEGKVTFPKKTGPIYQQSVKLPAWGQVLSTHECNVLDRLTLLADLCRKNDIWLGLDSWDKAHMIGHDNIIKPEEEERVFTAFSHTWVKAIRLMRDRGILERAVWIAPMNEVPHFFVRKVQSVVSLEKKIRNEGEVILENSDVLNEIYRRCNHWMGEAIKEEIAKENIPLSYSSLGAEPFGRRLTDIYDVVDVHFMPGVIQTKEDTQRLEKAGKGASGFSSFNNLETYNLKVYSEAWDIACRNNYDRMLARVSSYFKQCLQHLTLSSGKHLVPIITESFGPCYWPDHPDVSWKWYKQYNADAVRIITSLPFAGTSLSNFAEPAFSLWKDKDWHRNSNFFILNSRFSKNGKSFA